MTGPYFTVPAGTPASTCRGPSCGARIYWIRPKGVAMPIDCDADEKCQHPSATNDKRQADLFAGDVVVRDGRGVSHFATCPDAEHFRRRHQTEAAS